MSGSTVFHRNLRQHLVSRRMRGWNFVYLCASVVTLHPLLGDGVMSAMLLLKLNADELCSKLAVFKVKLKSNIIIWPTLSEVSNTRSSAAADGPRDALSVKILSTVETICTKNLQQIAVMQLEGYSRPTCSKQPRLVDCRIGVVNKLYRRRRRFLLITRSTCRGKIF